MKSFICTTKKAIRLISRKILAVRNGETISNALNRHRINIVKKFDKRKASIDDFEKCLEKCGINSGDTIVLHSSWRGCYMLDATPQMVIDCILNMIGENGNLLMPAYGSDYTFFDINNTKSNAGVLSEVFRTKYDVHRSAFPVFSMCAYGNKSRYLVNEHINSKGAFDKFSPYYKAIVDCDAKILFIGMGKKPYKITSFHFSSFKYREDIKFYGNVYNFLTRALVITNEGQREIEYINSKDYTNNKRVFRFLMSKCNPTVASIHGINVVKIDGKKSIQISDEYCKNDGRIYKHRIAL